MNGELVKTLVHEENGQAVTTSLIVAEAFGKRHAHVLDAIKNLAAPMDFIEPNFRLVEYADRKGEKRPMYIITRDGFSFLVMGFTGKKAAEWKIKYIGAFNAMEQHILERKQYELQQEALKQFNIPTTLPGALRLALDLAEKKEVLEAKNAQLESTCAVLEAEAANLKPKADAFDEFIAKGKAVTIQEYAALLNIPGLGRNNMLKYLRETGYLMDGPKDRKNLPYRKFLEQGLFEVRKSKYTANGEVNYSHQTLITPKGMVKIRERILQDTAFAAQAHLHHAGATCIQGKLQ